MTNAEIADIVAQWWADHFAQYADYRKHQKAHGQEGYSKDGKPDPQTVEAFRSSVAKSVLEMLDEVREMPRVVITVSVDNDPCKILADALETCGAWHLGMYHPLPHKSAVTIDRWNPDRVTISAKLGYGAPFVKLRY